MSKYITISNLNCSSIPLLEDYFLSEIEKVIWYKKAGEYVNPGEVLCEVHCNDFIFEAECYEGGFLLYQNTNTEISFSSVLVIWGEKNEPYKHIFQQHEEELKNINTLNTPLFTKKFTIENNYNDDYKDIID